MTTATEAPRALVVSSLGRLSTSSPIFPPPHKIKQNPSRTMMLRITILATLLAASSAWTAEPATTTRRGAFSQIAGAAAAAALVSTSSPGAASALDGCPSGANNCVRKSWSPPTGTSKDDAITAVRAALNSYPQEGQNKVDGGGWTLTSDDLGSGGSARVEFRSSGTGFFAKSFNGGRPFVDDLALDVDASGTVQVKSSSRIGDSDMGVNAKRVDYLANSLKAKGWSV